MADPTPSVEYPPDLALARLRADRIEIPDYVIARGLDVDYSTVHEWSEGRRVAGDEAGYKRLIWCMVQARTWYLRTMPATLAVWKPGPLLERLTKEGRACPTSEYFSRVEAEPHGRDVVEFRLKLEVDFESLAFVAFGPDRQRVRLCGTRAAATNVDPPTEEAGSSLTFIHSDDPDQAHYPQWTPAKLRPRELLSIFVRYLP